MILRLFIISSILHFGYSNTVVGQEDSESIEVIAMTSNDNILLRWAPSDAISWRLLNKYGYAIIREVIVKDGELIKPLQSLRITENLSLQPLEKWESIVDDNDYAAIAAQAIYGTTFDVSTGSSDVVSIISNAQDEQQRFSMAQLANDHDFQTAQMSGLAFKDTNVIAGERYLYKIISNVPPTLKKIGTGYVYIGLMDSTGLPVPEAPSLDKENGAIKISWSSEQYRRSYNYFVIERSVNGKTFERIGSLTHVTLSNQNFRSNLSYAFDKPKEDFRQVKYRLRGVNAFGITGPPSKETPFFSTGNDLESPAIISYNLNDSNSIELIYETNNLNELNHEYKLERSDKFEGAYTTIAQRAIANSTRVFVDSNPNQVNYYRITASDQTGERKSSMPYLVQIDDDDAPKPPVGLVCWVDSVGKVQLNWEHNKEVDLKGYFVYGSNGSSQEFSLLGKGLLEDTTFVESIILATLSKHRFYCVNAVDNRLNASSCSDTIIVRRPDIISPTPPVWLDYEVTTRGVEISWSPSSSKDTKEYLIYRQSLSADNFRVIGEKKHLDSVSIQFIDTTILKSGIYQYTLDACDSSGNCSGIVTPLTLKTEPEEDQVIIEEFLVESDPENNEVHLTWNISEPSEISSYSLYRKTSDQSFRLIANLNNQQLGYDDDLVNRGETYSYWLKVNSKKGITLDQQSFKIKF